jgi:hypothetical protein
MNIKQYFSNLLDRILDFFGLQRKPKINLTQTGFTETFKIKPVEETAEVEEKGSVRTAIDAYKQPSKEWLEKYQFLLEYNGNDSNYDKLYQTRKWSNPTNSPLIVDFDTIDVHNADETNVGKPTMKELLNNEQYESRLALRKNDDNWLNSKKRKVLTSKVIGSVEKFINKEDKVEEKSVDFLTTEELKQHMSGKNMSEIDAIFDLDEKTKVSQLLPDTIREAMKREMLKDLPVEELPKKDKSNG